MSRDSGWLPQFHEGDLGEGLVATWLERDFGWRIHRAEGYEPAYDLELISEPDGRLLAEVKSQLRARRYGSVFVELEVRDRPAGLATTSADVWVFVVAEHGALDLTTQLLPISVKRLRQLVNWSLYERGIRSAPSGSHPGRGAVVTIDNLERAA